MTRVNAVQLRKEIIAEYGKLDAKSLIELIHALDYADIPLLLEIACDVVKKSDSWEDLALSRLIRYQEIWAIALY